MAKGSIVIDVEARTQKASQKIKSLQQELTSAKGISSLGKSMQGIGLDALGGQLSQLGSVGSALGQFAAPAAAIGGVAVIAKGLGDMAERGQEAATAAEKMNTSLTTLSRNFGGTGAGVQAVTRDLQMMAANGVASLDDVNNAMKTLTVAYGGNVVKAGEMVKGLDDIAAGTGTSISQWASLTAKINENGVETKDLNRLARQGIPIWDAFASAMGTTADDVKQLAKEGKLGVDNWNKAVQELSKNYAGLSAAMSSQTIEGAQGTYQAMRSMEMQSAAEGRNRVMIDGLNQLSSQIQKQLDDPVRQEELRQMGQLAGHMDLLGQRFKEVISDLPSALAKGMYSVGESLADAWTWVTGGDNTTRDVRMQSFAAGSAFLPNLADVAESIQMFAEGKTSGDVEGMLKETTEALRRLSSADLTGLNDETKQAVADGIQRLTEQQSALTKALDLVKGQEDVAKAEQAKEDAEAAAAEAGQKTAEEFKKMLLDAAKKSGDPEKMLKAYFGSLDGTVEDYLKGIAPLERMIQAGLGDEQMMQRYKILKEVQDAYTKQLDAEAKAKQQAAAEADKAAIEYKAGIARDIASTQRELDSVNAKIQQQQMAAQEIADEEAHGIYRDKWGGLDVSQVKSVDSELLKQQSDLASKMAELNKKQANADQHIADSINSVNRFTNALANRTISINAVVSPTRVG